MQITAEEMMKLMLNFFNNTDQDLKEEREKLGNVDSQMSDLDHYLEAHTLKAGELAKIAKERQKLCRKRRQIKNNICLINILKKFVDKWKQKLITGDIIQKLKEYTQEIERQDHPVYRYRTNIISEMGLPINENENVAEDDKIEEIED